MPRRNRIQGKDLDFDIHIDPSCLSAITERTEETDRASMSGEKPDSEVEASASASAPELTPDEAVEPNSIFETTDTTDMAETVDVIGDNAGRVVADESIIDDSLVDDDAEGRVVEDSIAEDGLVDNGEGSIVEDSIVDDNGESSIVEDSIIDDNGESSIVEDSIIEDSIISHTASVDEENSMLSTGSTPYQTDAEAVNEETANEDDSFLAEDMDHDEGASYTTESRRESATSDKSNAQSRRASGRTEAMIAAAARDIVNQLEHENQSRDSLMSSIEHDDDDTIEADARSAGTHRSDANMSTTDVHDFAGRNSLGSIAAASGDEAGDSSSHHENDDDVFSDHSPRSSVGSMSESERRKMEQEQEKSLSRMTRSPRVSDISHLNGEDDGEDDDFIPTVRGTPRPPFRSPSSVKALQMSSPPASVFGSPRSSRREQIPAVARLGSPWAQHQHSPKRTPPRFRKNTPPLVLLHATLLPLRWPWADVLDGITRADDELSTEAKALRDGWRQLQDRMGDTTLERGILLPHPQNDYEVLEERLLEALELPLRRRARILECGHYLGPSNDMSAEDDDSEASDEDTDPRHSTARTSSGTRGLKRHWCSTCRSEISVESLGVGKIFRVKVYASNGLMKAGAWEACWKEMERVDVEIEPIVEPAVQEELARLAAEQEKSMELHVAEEEHDVGSDASQYLDEVPMERQEESFTAPDTQHAIPSSPPPAPEIRIDDAPYADDERRWRDQERLREIYGHTPPGHADPMPRPEDNSPRDPTPHHEYASPPGPTPSSPSAEAFQRRESRRATTTMDGNATLPELLLEAARVFVLDRRNVVIAVLGFLALMLAMRGAAPQVTMPSPEAMQREMEREPRGYEVVKHVPEVQVQMQAQTQTQIQVQTVTVTQEVVPVQTVEVAKEAVVQARVDVERLEAVTPSAVSEDPCSMASASPSAAVAGEARALEDAVSSETVRVVHTVTETAVETATVTQTYTEVFSSASATEAATEPEVVANTAGAADQVSFKDVESPNGAESALDTELTVETEVEGTSDDVDNAEMVVEEGLSMDEGVVEEHEEL